MEQPLLSRFYEPTHLDVTMAPLPGIVTFADTHDMPLPTIADPMNCRRPLMQEAG